MHDHKYDGPFSDISFDQDEEKFRWAREHYGMGFVITSSEDVEDGALYVVSLDKYGNLKDSIKIVGIGEE